MSYTIAAVLLILRVPGLATALTGGGSIRALLVIPLMTSAVWWRLDRRGAVAGHAVTLEKAINGAAGKLSRLMEATVDWSNRLRY